MQHCPSRFVMYECVRPERFFNILGWIHLNMYCIVQIWRNSISYSFVEILIMVTLWKIRSCHYLLIISQRTLWRSFPIKISRKDKYQREFEGQTSGKSIKVLTPFLFKFNINFKETHSDGLSNLDNWHFKNKCNFYLRNFYVFLCSLTLNSSWETYNFDFFKCLSNGAYCRASIYIRTTKEHGISFSGVK